MTRLLTLILAVFCFLPLEAADTLMLKDKLALAESGDFLVTYQNKAFTIMHIAEKNDATLIIEEISVPGRHRNTYARDWHEWMKSGAPAHSSWVVYEIDLRQGAMLEYYSYTKQGWADVSQNSNFLSSLLNLQLEKIPDGQRKRLGPPPRSGRDTRKLWNPKVVMNGKTIKGVQFDAWQTSWPQDGSELAGKVVEVYLPKTEGAYPSYFPYWIQLKDGALQAKMRIVDSGTGMQSPKNGIPRRPPEFIGGASYENGQLQLKLKSRPYYKSFTLLAVNSQRPHEAPILLAHAEELSEDLEITLKVEPEVLHQKLVEGQRYHFYVTPVGFEDIFSRTEEPQLWAP